MIQISSADDMQQWSRQQTAQGRSISFVPTLGCLHQGHAALLQQANSQTKNTALVLSIFVNPLQFRSQQYSDYPRNLAADLAIAQRHQVAAVFIPTLADIYPTLPSLSACSTLKTMPVERDATRFKSITPWAEYDFNYLLAPETLALKMDGILHPWFFDGVATVVSRLFDCVQPDHAFFGEKDPQQLAILQQLALMQHPAIQVIGVPTIRDNDGVASSSRNTLLNKTQRDKVATIAAHLASVAIALKQSAQPFDTALKDLHQTISAIDGISIDFLQGVNPHSLEPLSAESQDALLYLAYFIEGIRLTDERYIAFNHPKKN